MHYTLHNSTIHATDDRRVVTHKFGTQMLSNSYSTRQEFSRLSMRLRHTLSRRRRTMRIYLRISIKLRPLNTRNENRVQNKMIYQKSHYTIAVRHNTGNEFSNMNKIQFYSSCSVSVFYKINKALKNLLF